MCLFERAWSLRGFDALLMDMLERTEWVEDLLDRITEIQVALARKFVAAGVAGGYFGDDYGAQRAMLFSPRLWRRLIKPRLAKLFAVFCGRGAAGDSAFRRRYPGDSAGPGGDRADHAESGAARGAGARVAPARVWREAEFLRRSLDAGSAAERHAWRRFAPRRLRAHARWRRKGRDWCWGLRTGCSPIFQPGTWRRCSMLSAKQSADWAQDSQARAERVAARFRERFAGEPELWARAPGRVDLMGSHTDYNRGFVLTLPIGRDTWIAARRRDDGTVRVHSMNLDDDDEFRLDAIDSVPESRWCNYVRGVAATLAERGARADGVRRGDPQHGSGGGGLSSSAALECALATVFEALGGWRLTPERKALLCQKAENEFVGVKCGILDQYSSCLGRGGCALLLDCRDLSTRAVWIAGGIRVVVCNTMSQRRLSGVRIRATTGRVRAGRRHRWA